MMKKVLSLILSLSMILTMVVTNVSSVGAVEQDNLVKLSFYSDPELTTPIASLENVGDTFYAKLTLKNFTANPFYAMQIVLDYDESVIQLANFSDGAVVDFKGSAQYDVTGTYGVKADNTIDLYNAQAMTRNNFTVTKNDNLPYVDTDEGIVNIMAFNTSREIPNDRTTMTGTSEAEFLRLRFVAVGEGEATFALNADYDDTCLSNGQKLGYQILNLSNQFFTANLDFPSIRVGTTPYAAPQTVTVNNNREINWTAVSGAAGYNVVVKAKREGGTLEVVDTQRFNDANVTSYNVLPEIIGEVVAEVSAISPDSDTYADSAYTPSDPVEFFANLADPEVSWTERTLSWTAVAGADGYAVVLKKDNVQVYSETVTGTSVDLSQYFTAVEGSEDVYTATVKAVGADKYVVDSAEVAATPITIYGDVAVPTAQKWEQNSWVATWNASADSANVSGYGLILYKGQNIIGDYSTSTTSFDFTSIIEENGVGSYMFEVYAIGKGGYGNSAKVKSGDKASSKQLEPVEELVWNDRILTWKNNNEFKGSYEITLYKNGSTTPFGSYTTSATQYDFDSVIGTVTGVDYYKAEVVAIGNGVTYTDSLPAETDNHPFYPQLDDVTNLSWSNWSNDNWIADWDEVVGATGYEVSLYREGVLVDGSIKTTEPGITEYDYTSFVKRPGSYTFKVKALGDEPNYSSSGVVEVPTSQIKNVVTRGEISIKAYSDPELTTLVGNEIAVGDTFYAAVSIDNAGDPDYNVSAFNLPVKFNKDVIKVADENGMVLADSVLTIDDLDTNGIILGEIFNNDFDPVVNELYPAVDNTNGIVKFIGYTTLNDKKIDAETTLIVIKFVAVAKTTLAEVISFADSNDAIYDATAPAGDEFSYNNVLIYPDDTNAKVDLSIVKGVLPAPLAPEFGSNKVLSWTKVEGAVGYEIVLYKGANEQATITVDSGDQVNIDLDSYIFGSGKYTAKIKAIGDGVEADSSAYSPLSNEYVIKSGGSYTPQPPKDDGEEPPVVEPPVDDEKVTFTDIDGHWAEDSIIELEAYKVIEGYGDNTFRPDFGITRAEFTKMMVVALGLEVTEATDNIYLDTKDHWSRDYVAVATKEGIVNGIDEDMFAPDVIISREQVAAIIWRIAGRVEVTNDSTYKDKATIEPYAQPAVEYVTDEGYMIGFTDGTFRPAEQTNRAQAATVILRLIKSDFFKTEK